MFIAGIALTILFFVAGQRSAREPFVLQSVDLPITSHAPPTCSNFCNPAGKCAQTGDQCVADTDCPHCQAATAKSPQHPDTPLPGNNDAGKLTTAVTPSYSALTTNYGTLSPGLYSSKAKVVRLQHGVNTWRKSFDAGDALFRERYAYPEGQLPFQPAYPKQTMMLGDMQTDGPLPANYVEEDSQ